MMRLVANDTISFGKGLESSAALSKGWSKPEAGLVWSDGPYAALRFRIVDAPLQFSIVMQASPFLTDTMSAQRLAVFGNGLHIDSLYLRKDGVLVIKAPPFLTANIRQFGSLDLAFDIPDCRSGSGNDRRMLGFALHTLRINDETGHPGSRPGGNARPAWS